MPLKITLLPSKHYLMMSPHFIDIKSAASSAASSGTVVIRSEMTSSKSGVEHDDEEYELLDDDQEYELLDNDGEE